MDVALDVVSVWPEAVDGSLAVVVDEERRAMAVWKGRSRIDVFDLDGTWHQEVSLDRAGGQGTWARAEVLAMATRALTALVSGAEGSTSRPLPSGSVPGRTVRIGVEALGRAWLVRARARAYSVWDGGRRVHLYNSEGVLRHQVQVTPADLASLSRLMLGLLATPERDEGRPDRH